MIYIVSYSYPPDNVPAAHRPSQLAEYLSRQGIAVVVCSRHGIHSGPTQVQGKVQQAAAAKVGISRLRMILAQLQKRLGVLIQVDKGLPWALSALWHMLPIIRRRSRQTGTPPVIWATAPLVSNLYVAGALAWLTKGDLHLDLRDAIDGFNERRMPWLTRLVVRRARTLTAVTETLARFIDESAVGPPAEVVLNGISPQSVECSRIGVGVDAGWVEVTYTGAVYGGERPYLAAVELLAKVAEGLPDDLLGLRLTIASREDLSALAAQYSKGRLIIRVSGEVSKMEALRMSAQSEINLILVGARREHRCGIPLKTYDLLGVGRPILYMGPVDSDAATFLRQHGSNWHYIVDSDALSTVNLNGLNSWLLGLRRIPSKATSEPSSTTQSAKIVEVIGVES